MGHTRQPPVTETSEKSSTDGAGRSGPFATLRSGPMKDVPAAHLMALPGMALFILFAAIPIGWLVWTSFTRFTGFGDATWVGFSNYAAVLDDSAWWRAVSNTFVFAAGRIVIEIPIALGLAYLLNKKIKGSIFFRTIYFLPFALSIAVIGLIFGFLLRPTGPISGFFIGLGIVDQPIHFLGTATGAMLNLIGLGIWAGFGLNTVLFLAGLQTISEDVYEAARIDGAAEWEIFRRITLPLLAPITKIVVLLTIIQILRSFDIVKTFTDGRPAGGTEIMFTYMFRFFFEPESVPQFGYAAALGITGSLIIAAVASSYLLFTRRVGQ